MRYLAHSLPRPSVCPSCRFGLLVRTRGLAGTSKVPEIYDIVCVGGGPAGLALLTALGSSPITSKLKVALIESQPLSKARSWNPESNSFSNRVSSLTPSSISFLESIGAWQRVDIARVQPYQGMQVWDGVTGSRISFHSSEESSPTGDLQTVATMTENANLVRGLLARITTLGDNVSVFSNATVTSITNGIDYQDGPDLSSWPILSFSPSPGTAATTQASTIAARLLVGADGINSPVRSFAGISIDGWDYHRHGVVANLSLSPTDGRRTAYQRFLPNLGGPVALLPLPNNHATLVWSTTVQNAAYLKSLPPDAFTAMVNAAFRLSMTDLSYMFTLARSAAPSHPASTTATTHGEELSWRLQHTSLPSFVPPSVTSVQPGSVASFPLRYRHASSYISPRIALVGDAAHVIHPLGGQGLNLGMGDVASLHRTIEYAVCHGMDIGDLLSLEQYAADRWLVNAKVCAVCDLLHKIYNVPGYGPVAWGRSLGLEIVDRLPLLKGFLMRQAAGA